MIFSDSIQEPRQNMLGHMYTEAWLLFDLHHRTKFNPQLMLKLLSLIKFYYSYSKYRCSSWLLFS